jgi:CRP-like cAMP-binding protein
MNLSRALRLVSTGPERQALQAGEVDAVIDAAGGNVFLLPEAKRALSSRGGEPANGLLAALPRQHYQRLLAELDLVPLASGEVLYQPGERMRYVYFPNDAVVALLVVMDEKSLQVGLVGREGMVGVPLALGAEKASVRAVVQGSGSALRMKAAGLAAELGRCAPLQRELQRYAHAKLVQARHTAGCGRFHEIEARLACWLLMTHDRVRADRLQLTHEFLADMLGVRRVGVTNAATALQRRGLIEYRRGEIRVLERKGLEAAACRCYPIVSALAG